MTKRVLDLVQSAASNLWLFRQMTDDPVRQDALRFAINADPTASSKAIHNLTAMAEQFRRSCDQEGLTEYQISRALSAAGVLDELARLMADHLERH